MNLTVLLLLLVAARTHAQTSAEASDLTTASSEALTGPPPSPRQLVLTAQDMPIVRTLRKFHFQLRAACPFDLGRFYAPGGPASHCPTTADYLHCFPTTRAGLELRFACPFREGVLFPADQVFASRQCRANATWGPSNYERCIRAITALLNARETDEALLYRRMADFTVAGFSLTIVCVTVAIAIFASFRSLRCLRNMIHSNMLATFLLKCSTYIAFYVFVLGKDDPIAQQNNVTTAPPFSNHPPFSFPQRFLSSRSCACSSTSPGTTPCSPASSGT